MKINTPSKAHVTYAGSADLGHRCLHFTRLMDFNKRRETSAIAYRLISWSWIVLPQFFWIIESAQKKKYEKTWLPTQESMETAWSAADRRKARLFKKYKHAAALLFFIACSALFAYMSLVWHSKPSNLTCLESTSLLCCISDIQGLWEI
jgi:hypothetical protein